MRFSLYILLSALTTYGAFASPTKNQVAQPKSKWQSYVVTFEEDTPKSIMTTARQKFLNVGSEITHEFKILMGFSVVAPASIVDDVVALHKGVTVEADQVVSVNPIKASD